MSESMSSEVMTQMHGEFFSLVFARRAGGIADYGQFGFMENDTFRMMFEELADLVNYAFFTFIKIRLLEEKVGHVLGGNSPNGDAGAD